MEFFSGQFFFLEDSKKYARHAEQHNVWYSALALKPECSDRPPDSGLNPIRIRGSEGIEVQMGPGPGSGFRFKLDPV